MDALLIKDGTLRSQLPGQEGWLSAAGDPVLNDLAQLAAQTCDTPVALICLSGPDCLYLKAATGMDAASLATAHLPYERAMKSGAVHQIPDLRQWPEATLAEIAIAGDAFHFYAATPLETSQGDRIGALIVLDRKTRSLTEHQTKALCLLARQAALQTELIDRQAELAEWIRQRTESARTAEGNFVASVLDEVGALVIVFDTEGRIVHLNRAAEAASGYDFSTLAGKYFWDCLIPKQHTTHAIESFNYLKEGVFPAILEESCLNKNEGLRQIAWAATALHDSEGKVAFLIATGTDVTIQRTAELTLRESEAKYRQLVEGSLGMVFTHDLEGKLLSLNTHGAMTVGRTVEEMVGRPLQEFIPPERQTALKDYLRTIRDVGEAQGQLHMAHSDGEVRVITYRNKLIDVPERTPYVLGFGIDITEQVRTERKLNSLTRQSNSILESVGDGIFCIDLEGRVTVVNTAAAQMLGYSQEEMLGYEMHSLIHHTKADGEPYPVSESPVFRSLSNFGTARVIDEVFWRKDGTSFPVEYIARPLVEAHASESGGTRANGVVVAFTDTTERRALDRMKDEFISTVSHELRTPLTSLRGALGLLSGGALEQRPEKSEQMLEIAISNTDRLVRLVNDILDLERISSGKSELRMSMVRADWLLNEAINTQKARTPGLNMKIFSAPDEVRVWADPDRVLQVLNNLLSNAIKFSKPDGEIHLTARKLSEQEAIFEVRDHGRGIASEKLENIFERFRQGDASDSRALGGTGLGLAICRSIVNQHGGKIWATSTVGQGTTFHFTLPNQQRTTLR